MTTTPSYPKKRSPYIVREIDSRMLRKHPELSKGARILWLTMLGMADAKTGELRHRDHWYSGIEIDMRAQISDRTRKLLIQELALAGYVYWERDRIKRVLKDRLTGHLRMRCVSGRTKYVVSKWPRKDWVSNTAAQKSPRKHWGASKVKISRPVESRNTPNKTGGQNEKSPHKQRSASKVKFLHGARISPASLSVNHHNRGGGVSDDPTLKKSVARNSSSSSPAKPDDDESRTAIPKQVTPETPEQRAQRFKESAFVKIKSKHGNLFSETEIRESLDDFEIRAGSPPNSDKFFVTCFDNEISESKSESESASLCERDRQRVPVPREQLPALVLRHLGVTSALFDDYCKVCEAVGHPIQCADFRPVVELERLRNAGQSPTAVLEQAIVTSSYTLHPVKNRSHDDLLKDTTNFGKLLWGGRCIVVCIGGVQREILSRNTAQAMTGCSAEHMAEHLRATGFWAEVYTPTVGKAKANER